jgi:acetyl-CoA synthetase
LGRVDAFEALYARSVESPDEFWAEMAARFHWESPWNKVLEYNSRPDRGPVFFRWFGGGRTNLCHNAIDRHLPHKAHQPALLWEGSDPGERRQFTYQELRDQVARVAGMLEDLGLRTGDRVTFYLPMIPELALAMLASARLGLVHSVVFAGLSSEALKDRLIDSSSRLLITSDGMFRGGRRAALKPIVDQALRSMAETGRTPPACLVVRRMAGAPDIECPMTPGRDFWWEERLAETEAGRDPVWLDAEAPLFILYTSGATGKPKGVLHTTGGYMVYTGITHYYVFDHQEGDVFWSTADLGWITGHSYSLYGPLLCGGATLMLESGPTWPDPGRYWDVVDRWGVNTFYTTPTTLRALKRLGDSYVYRSHRESLRLLGTVGEPIGPETWRWFYEVVGESSRPIVDTWWQTETGGILISGLPGAVPAKPGSAAWPFFGIVPAILDDEGRECPPGPASGRLAIRRPWPGIARTLYNAHERYETDYFSDFEGYYFTGDGARRDEDGYYWITGRVDDVIQVAGLRLGTAEVESALVGHPAVAEAAVVGYPHAIKGQGVYAYVTLKEGRDPSPELEQGLRDHVRREIGPLAAPDVVHWTPALPKTRSGKILRRILRKVAAGEAHDLGDTGPLADPLVLQALLRSDPSGNGSKGGYEPPA